MYIKQMHIPVGRVNNPNKRITPTEIILHYIGNAGTSAKNNAVFFAYNCPDRRSANYVVDDNDIYECIPAGWKSYGTDNGAHNGKAIQIEMCHPDATGRISEATLNNVVGLCRELISEYGCKDIIRHYDVTGKRCPLWYVNNPAEWEKLKARILQKEAVKVSEAPEQKLGPHEWAEEAMRRITELGIMKGDENGDLRPRDNMTREEFAVMTMRHHDVLMREIAELWKLIK